MNRHYKLTPVCLGIISALYGSLAFAQQETAKDDNEQSHTEVVVVKGQQLTIDRQELEQAPVDNPSMSQVLKHQPRIGINDAQTSMQNGNLAPEEISISGARPHQTKYTIGGIGINNSTTFDASVARPTDLTSGHTSGYFLDTNLLESIEVHDHNIDAEHGGFTGGVVEAELRKPTEDFTIDYNFRMNDSDWNSGQKVGDNYKETFNSPIDGTGKYQPDFQKRMHALHLSGAINDTQKLALNVSHQVSDIPLKQGKDVDQTMDNIFLTHIWDLGRWQTTTDLRYTEHKVNNFENSAINDSAPQSKSNSNSSHSGFGGTIKVSGSLPYGQWDTQFAYDRLEDKRESNENYYLVSIVRTSNGMVIQDAGGNGNLTQTQQSYQFKSTFNANPIDFYGIENTPSVGVELGHHTGSVDRPSDHAVYNLYHMRSPIIRKLTRYQATNYDVKAKQHSLFAGNQMQWDRWGLYLGGRVDKVSVFDTTVFSPRFNTSWDFDLVDTNRITFGANRYYSANLLGWALKAEQKKYQSLSDKCTAKDGNWQNLASDNLECLTHETYEGLDLSDADIPYSDELSLAWAIDIGNFAFNTVYINRQHRDGISYTRESDEGTATLHNNVKSTDEIYSIEAETIHPYEFAGGHFSANWKISYNQRSGSGDQKDKHNESNNLNGGYEDEWVLFDGKLVRASKMDVSGYQAPIMSSLDLNMFWQDLGLVWNNRVNYQQGRTTTAWEGAKTVEIDGKFEAVNSVISYEVEDLITWDMAVNWTPTQLNDHLTIGLSATNVLNNQQVISITGTSKGNIEPNAFYNQGRQVWLNVRLRN